MFKRILPMLVVCAALLVGGARGAFAAANSTIPANGVLVNETGTSGVCVSVTSGAAVTVAHGDPNATSTALYSTQAMNCSSGTTTDVAPTTTPTTGAIGTGAGWPLPATSWLTIAGARVLQYGQGVGGSTPLNLAAPGDRIDCIAVSTTGNICSFRTY